MDLRPVMKHIIGFMSKQFFQHIEESACMVIDYWSLWRMLSQVFQGSIAENCGRSILFFQSFTLLTFCISPSRVLYWSVNFTFLFLLATFETGDTRDLGTFLEEQKGWVRHTKQSQQWKPKSPLFLSFVMTLMLCRRTDTDGPPPMGCVLSAVS